MLILCSNGSTSEKLLASVSERATDRKMAALVATADNEYKEKDHHVQRCVEGSRSLNLTVDIFDIDKQPAGSLLNHDIVGFIGGDPFYLLHSIRENNALNTLRYLADNKILIGWSAAAFVFDPTLELVNIYSSEMNFLGSTDLNGIALTDVEVLPHYDRSKRKSERFEERCHAYEEKRNVKVIRIDDGDGIFIDGEEISICRI